MPDFCPLITPPGTDAPDGVPPMDVQCDHVRIHARILGHGHRHGRFCPATFDIQVRIAGAEYQKHIVQRRYSSFRALEAELKPRFEKLPPLPPKSNVYKLIRPTSFMADRERRLSVFLAALLAEDPGAEGGALKRFLGVGMFDRVRSRKEINDEERLVRSPSSTWATSCGPSTNLSMISEAENEDGSGFDVPEITFVLATRGDTEWDDGVDVGGGLTQLVQVHN